MTLRSCLRTVGGSVLPATLDATDTTWSAADEKLRIDNMTQIRLEKVAHTIDDNHRTSASSERVGGWTEWSSRYMASEYYGTHLARATIR